MKIKEIRDKSDDALKAELAERRKHLFDLRSQSVTEKLEGERFFEGTRAFLTADRIEKPFLNAYRLLARMGQTRLQAVSDAGRRVVSGISGARRVDWPGVARLPSMERPADFLALPDDWLPAG